MSAGAVDWHDDSEIPKVELLTACYRSDVKKVEELLVNKVHVDSTDDDLVTPLQIAAFTGNRELALKLLDAGADLEAASRTGMTAFHHACREGKMEVIDLLLQKGANIRKITRMGASALTLAAAGGHLDVVRKLVGLQVPVSEASDTCPTPLLAAAFRNLSPICVYLISKGAPIDQTVESLQGLSALTCSIVLSSRSMLITLLDRGADPTKKSFKRRSAFELALDPTYQDNGIYRTIQDRCIGASTKRRDIRQALLEDDFDQSELWEQRNQRLPLNCTPLHFSVAIGNMNAVRCLVRNGKELIDEAEHRIRLSPLQTAALLGQTDVLSFLIDKGANTNDRNSLNMTAFDCYIANGGEINEKIRSALHFARSKKADLNLGGSSSSLSKVLPIRGKELTKKFFRDRPTEITSVEAKQWRETRMHTFPMQGRNYQKLVTVENLLYGERTLKPKKQNSDDTVMDVMRALAVESTSFAVTCFYDWYTGDGEKKEMVDRKAGEYDNALKFSMLYGYPKQQPPRVRVLRDAPPILRGRSDSEPFRPLDPFGRRIAEPPKLQPSRTTPRAVKKQRDSVTYEDLRHQELRKTNSTGQLQMPSVVASRRSATIDIRRPSPASSMGRFDHSVESLQEDLKRELAARNMHETIRKLDEAEVEIWQLQKFTNKDFEEMGISSGEASMLLDLKKRLEFARSSWYSTNH